MTIKLGEAKSKAANKKLLENISYGAITSLVYWNTILEHFPICKKGKVNLILETSNKSIIMGIAVDHLKSVASIVGIPNVYIDIINQNQRWMRKHKDWGKHTTVTTNLKRDTYLLLKAVYHKVLQTGEA